MREKAQRIRRNGGLALTLTLSLALITTSNHQHWIVACLCLGIWVSLVAAFWDWASKPDFTPIERGARPVFLIVAAGLMSALFGWFFWRPDITIYPPKVVFAAREEKWLGDTYTFAVTNNTDEDKYGVNTVLLINSSDWSATDFILEPSCTDIRNLGNNIFDPEVLGLVQNRTHFPLFLVVWNRIKAHESRDVCIRHIKRTGWVNVTACVTSWHDESDMAPKVMTKSGVMTPFETPPETIAECGETK